MRYGLLTLLSTVLVHGVFAKDSQTHITYAFDESVIERYIGPGDCVEQSHTIKREDAWRCRQNSTIYDPCFVQQGGGSGKAVCFQSPWDRHALTLAFAKAHNNYAFETLDISKTDPWGVELANGIKCQATASSKEIEPVKYRCSNNTVLFGHLQRCNPEWSILQKDSFGHVTTATIEQAWF